MNIAIFANGVIENQERASKAAQDADLVIAANGGALQCLHLGIIPSIVVGDLDSLDAASRGTLEAEGSEFITHPRNKDETDLELALLSAVAQEANAITVLGAMGGRLDMTFANILLLGLSELARVHVEIWHGDQTAWLVRPPGGAIKGKPDDLVSLIPLGGDASGVATRDLKYSMRNEKLVPGPARGISNVIVGSEPRIELTQGAVLVVHTPSIDAQP